MREKYIVPEIQVFEFYIKDSDVICTSVDLDYGGVTTNPDDWD